MYTSKYSMSIQQDRINNKYCANPNESVGDARRKGRRENGGSSGELRECTIVTKRKTVHAPYTAAAIQYTKCTNTT